MPSPASSKLLLGPEQSSMLPIRTSCQRPPLFGRGQIVYVRPKAKVTEQSSSLRPVEDSLKDEPKSYLPKIPQCSSRESLLEEVKVSNGPMKLELSHQFLHEQEETHQGEKSNINFEISLDGLGSSLFCEKRNDEASTESPDTRREPSVRKSLSSRGPLTDFNPREISSPGRRRIRSSGKVSQLRRLFEQSSARFSSPLSFMSFRSRLDSEERTSEVMGDCLSSSWNESESPASTHTIARRRSMVPSLTTEISVNDFFCDFVGGANHEEISITASPSERTDEVEPQVKRESPVKHRIQQFEHLSRDSLKARPVADRHSKGNNNGPSHVSQDEKKRDDKHRMIANWIPIHQKGAAIWRKISSSLSRSVDSWKDCNSENEHTSPTTGTRSNTSLDRSSSLANHLVYPRRSSSFGYSMYRVSHTSRPIMSTSQTTPNIQLGIGGSSNSHPKRTLDVSSDPSCSGTSTVFDRNFPPATSMSSGLGQFGWFGLDGHFISKPVLDEDLQSSRATKSELSTSQGDPNVLHKVMRKQSAAERNRRRRGEKDERCDKKLRSLARWKGKSKTHASADSTVLDGETSRKHSREKGKGKEKEAEKNEGEKMEERLVPKGRENAVNKKTESGFVVFESKDVKLRHPKPRRPGQVRKVANMYRDKGSSGVSVNAKASSGATLKESRQGFRQKASSALGLRRRKARSASG